VLTPVLRSHLQERKAELIDWLQRAQSNGHEPRLYPPSFAQRRFWTLQQLNPADSFYNVPFAFRLKGRLDTSLLRESFNAIVRRHEVLRTTLEMRDGELMQVVAGSGEVNLRLADLGGGDLAELLGAEFQRPFDLARESGLRVLLVRLGDEEHLLLLCLHNTLYDQTSLMVLLDELSLHYAALVNGSSVALEAPTQYREYVRWQDTSLRERLDERVAYWREWFGRGEPAPVRWTPSLDPPAHPGFHTWVPWQRHTPELTRRLHALSRRKGVTLFNTLLAAYAVLLRRYTGASDITIGTTYSDRQHWQFASLIGATIDVPALRIDMTDNPDFLTLVGRARTVVSGAVEYQDVPFERIAPSLNRKSSGPLFRVVFSFFPEMPHARLQLPGVEVEYLEELINELSRPDLYLVLWENQTTAGDALTGYFLHKRDVFAEETSSRMCREFQVLLEAIVANPMRTVEQLLAGLGGIAGTAGR
jgi:condensation domain-containing protein